jgi:hypothetical protein
MAVATLVTPLMRQGRKFESPEERWQRLLRKAKRKKVLVAMDDATVDRMIRENIEQYGP